MVIEERVREAEQHAWSIAAAVVDPELPMLTLADLGVLREVRFEQDEGVVVTLTPTYSGCPAIAEMRADVRSCLAAAGYSNIEVRTALYPPWTSDWISAEGRRKLAEHGIAPPGAAPSRAADGPVPLTLGPTRRAVRCPRCGSGETAELSRFGSTACKALRRCTACSEPFEHFKEI